MSRRQIREIALQVLFLWDAHAQASPEQAEHVANESTSDPAARQQALAFAAGAWEQRQATDRWVERVAPQWPTYRQPPVDRNLLRLAVWEMINTTTPPRVVIDEAIELAKRYSTEQSASFVNGVLDAILKEHQTLTATEQPGDQATKGATDI